MACLSLRHVPGSCAHACSESRHATPDVCGGFPVDYGTADLGMAKTPKRSTKKAPTRRSNARGSVAAARKAPPRPTGKRTRESRAAREQRARAILKTLRELYPQSATALRHRSAFELLTATILSAQCTDKRVNLVTPDLFRRYPDAPALAAAQPDELEVMIRSTGFFRNKAKNLLGMSRAICEEFNGSVPDSMDGLLTLPGVARKTANCVLGTWYAKNEGLVVDTHVGRLALRLRLLTTARDDKDAVKIERDLMALFPQDSWTYLAHALIDHGRQVCTARKPKCDECGLAEHCPSAETLS